MTIKYSPNHPHVTGHIKVTRMHVKCTSCGTFDGFSFQFPHYKCIRCGLTVLIKDMLSETLATKTSDLWHAAFHLIDLYKLVKISEGHIYSHHLNLRANQSLEINFNERGLPADARILYMNFTPYSPSASLGSVLPALNFMQIRKSIDEIPHHFFLFGVPMGFEGKPPEDAYSELNLMLRWCQKDIPVWQNHLIKAAEGFWSDDLPLMIYNSFAAIELRISDAIEKFWLDMKMLNSAEYESLFGRDGAEKQLTVHLPIICGELGIDISGDKNFLKLISSDLRKQRNNVVHEGKITENLNCNKSELYASACWLLVLLEYATAKIEENKRKV